ncbi:hypothetical protein JCM19239_5301 [Vibrio variabilis]|uniref:MFS transporter n=1 Tax=Vibrio variabilis TaxID=990271 RepID=A0ABQ0JNQ9_9VIBR|nr:hypothetical protein JCM19239_5301 [Vibrio variabilis]
MISEFNSSILNNKSTGDDSQSDPLDERRSVQMILLIALAQLSVSPIVEVLTANLDGSM